MGAIQFGIKETKNSINMKVNLFKVNFFPGEILKGEIKLNGDIDNPNVQKTLKNLTVIYSLIHREYWQNHENLSESMNIINEPNQVSDEGKLADDIKHTKEEIIFSKKEVYNNLKSDYQKEITIPFKIPIPQNSRASIEFLHTAKTYAYSRTYLNIHLPEKGNEGNILIFILRSPVPIKSDLSITKSFAKKKLGFIGAANNVNLKFSYEKNYYGFNEACLVNLKVDAAGSKENIKSLAVVLKRKINFLINGSKPLIKSNEFTEDLWKNTMENFDSQDINFRICLIESPKVNNNRKSIFVDFNSVSNSNLICLLPSYEGKFVKCEYYLKVKISFDSMLIKDPEFNMPLDLGHTNSPFLQTFVFDINKILFNYNSCTSIPLMIPDSDNKDGNKGNNLNIKENIQKVFGTAKQNIINKSENLKKIFGNVNINNNNKINEKPTPENENQISNQIQNQNKIQNNNLENSADLPSLEELNMVKNEQAAPGLGLSEFSTGPNY